MRERLTSRITLAVLALAGVLAAVVPPAADARPEVFTTVEHNVTLGSEFFPDDICGPRAVTETVTNKVQVNHVTANADGSFHVVDFETGTVVADYVDPAILDQTFRRTNRGVQPHAGRNIHAHRDAPTVRCHPADHFCVPPDRGRR